MRKKSMLVQLTFLLLFLLIIVGFTPARNILNTNAQNVISPTYGCLSPGCAGSAVPSTASGIGAPVSIAVASPLPSSPVVATSPVSSAAAQPCQTTIHASNGTGGDAHRGKRGGHHNGGFLREFFQLFLLLLEFIIKVGGGSGLPCSPSTTATPTAVPSLTLVPSVAPIVPTVATTTATASATTASSGASVVNTGAGSIFAGPFGNNSTSGQAYCSGHVVTGGQTNGLYTCQPHDAPTLKQQCPAACKVNASGNDSC